MIDWLTIDEFLDGPTLEELLSDLRQADAVAAPVYGGGQAIDPRVRSTRLVQPAEAFREHVKRLLIDVQPRIASHFDVALNTCEEPLFLRYQPGDFFVAHQDGNVPTIHDDSRHRRVSVVIFLNPGAHEGGSFVFHGRYPDWEKRCVVPAAPGSLVAFRSETTHEVTPVTEGTRYSVVSWYR